MCITFFDIIILFDYIKKTKSSSLQMKYKKIVKILIKDVELKMWEATLMPEAQYGTDGKMVKDASGKILNTGKMKEYTTYIFRDLVGEKLEIMSAKNNFRELEGETVNVVLNLRKTSFQGKTETKVSLDTVERAIKN